MKSKKIVFHIEFNADKVSDTDVQRIMEKEFDHVLTKLCQDYGLKPISDYCLLDTYYSKKIKKNHIKNYKKWMLKKH